AVRGQPDQQNGIAGRHGRSVGEHLDFESGRHEPAANDWCGFERQVLNALASECPSLPYAWTVVAILIATAVLSYTDRQVLSLLVDPIRGDMGISDTQISLLLGTAFAVVYGIAGIPLGYLADRISRRNLIFAGVCVWILGTLA